MKIRFQQMIFLFSASVALYSFGLQINIAFCLVLEFAIHYLHPSLIKRKVLILLLLQLDSQKLFLDFLGLYILVAIT